MTSERWKIELFGPLCARRGERVVHHFRTHKTGALLACLAGVENRAYRREEIIETLWPEYDPDSGRNCLRMALNALRQQLEIEDLQPGSVLIADRHSVQLNPESFTTDKAEFEAALRTAQIAPSDAAVMTCLTRAAELYRSDLLPGYDEDWILGERQRLADAHLQALRRIIALHFKAREYDVALDYARRALNADPLREESHRTLMQLYVAVKRPNAALRQYEELARLLRRELKAAPSAATKELAAQIAKMAGVVGAPMVSADSHARRGQVLRASAGSQPPAQDGRAAILDTTSSLSQPRSRRIPSPSSSHLPVPLTRFFGQEDCQMQLLNLIDSPQARLITLTGAGGCGKTRLALNMAERICDEYDGAVWFVPLASLTDPRQIVDAALHAMNAPRANSAPSLERLVQALSGRPSLLIFDNYEHLADRGAMIARTLLDRVPTLKCLITSRQRLNLAGEHELPVRPLATPAASGTPEILLEFPSVQLFVDRAQAARPNFELNASNANAIARLCHHLEGIPLAIELAAAYVQVMSPAQILERLSERLSLLVNRSKDAPSRHASLRAAIEWSYQLLSPDLQRFFAQLSVFRGGWTLEAAEQVAMVGVEGEEPAHGRLGSALEYLMQLRERSLISVEDTDAGMRFALLETIREYAAERLEASERAQTRRRHALFCLQMAEESETGLVGPDSLFWLNQLAHDHDNLRAALDWCAETGVQKNLATSTPEPLNPRKPEDPTPGPAEIGLRLAGALWRFWYIRGFHDEGFERLEKALERCPDAKPALRQKALGGAGNIAYNQQRYAKAKELYEQRLFLAKEIGDTRGMAAGLGSLGNIANDLGHYPQADVLFRKALNAFRELGDSRGVALTLANLGNVANDQKDYARACIYYEEGLHLFRSAGDRQNILLLLNNMAEAKVQTGDLATTRALLEESLSLARSLESKRNLAHSLNNCVVLAVEQNAMEHAALLMGAVEALRETINAPLPPKARPAYDQLQKRVRLALGERQFAQRRALGRKMNLEAILACALRPTGEVATEV